MTRALLITNPVAARHDARALAAVRETLRQGGWSVEVAATAAPGDARRFAERGRADGFDALLSYGGDGTAMQVAAALAGTGIPLGLLPGGTGNVLARNLHLPGRPVAAARTILRRTPISIDLGVVQRDDGPHYFAVCCGAGFDAALMLRTDATSKRRWRRAAYVRAGIAALRHVVSAPHRFVIDGVETRLRAAMALVCNCADLMPPLLRMHPDIRPDDGVLDLVVLQADGLWQSVTALMELLVRRGSARDQVWFARGRSIRIEVEGAPLPTQLDGDVVGTTPLDIHVLPGALTVFVDPATAPGGAGG
jgi:YegS/Rv2252/BmrU family lipid kinase